MEHTGRRSSHSFEANVADQRKTVALDLVEELRNIKQQRDDLLAACEAMVTDFDLGESCIKTSLRMMISAIKKARM